MPNSKEMTNSPAPIASGLQYSFRIFIGCIIVWFILDRMAHHNPLWALISVIIVTEPDLMTPGVLVGDRPACLGVAIERTVEVLLGCVVALVITFFASWIQKVLTREQIVGEAKG